MSDSTTSSADWLDCVHVTEARLASVDTRLIPVLLEDLARSFINDAVCHGMTVLEFANSYGLCVSDVWPVVDFLVTGKLINARADNGECECASCLAHRTWIDLPYHYGRDIETAEAQKQAEAIVREAPMDHPRPGHVYLMKCQDRYKIGISRDIPARQHQLQKQSPFPIELIHSAYGPDYKYMEQHLHAMYQGARVQGEWFELDDQQLVEVMTNMTEWERSNER